MTIQVGEAWKAYLKLSQKDEKGYVYGSPKLGRDSFYRMYDGMTRLIKEKHALSYYYTDALAALEGLRRLVARLETLWSEHHSPAAPCEAFAWNSGSRGLRLFPKGCVSRYRFYYFVREQTL